jgi:hypothetical protein
MSGDVFGFMGGAAIGGVFIGAIGVGIGAISSVIYGANQIKNFNQDATNNAIQTANIVGVASSRVVVYGSIGCIVGAIGGGVIGYKSNNRGEVEQN